MQSIIIALVVIFLLPGCSPNARPPIQKDMPQSALEGRGYNILSSTPGSVKIKLPADSFKLRGPILPNGQERIKANFVDQRFEDILLALSRQFKINIMIDSRVTKAEDIQAINKQIDAFNIARADQAKQQLQAAGPGASVVLQQPLPPVAGIQPRKPEGVNNSLETVATQSTDGSSSSRQYHPEDKEVFSRLTLEFDGTEEALFKRLSEISGLFFSKEGNVITARRIETFSVTIPTYPGILAVIEENLRANGANDVAYDSLTSTITFKSNYRGYLRMSEYLQKLKSNAALVTFRIIVLSVLLKDNYNIGIDWSKFTIGSGWKDNNQVLTGNTVSSNAMQLASGVSNAIGAVGGDGGISLLFQASNFNLSAFVGSLDDFGQTEISQNAFVECLSGTTGSFNVTTETEYVKNIGVAALSNNSSATQATTQSEKIKYGAEIEIKPYFNAVDKTLTVELDCKISELLGFNTWQGGNLGAMQLPEVMKKNIKNTLRLGQNQIAVIGGLIYTKHGTGDKGLPTGTFSNFLTRNKTGKKEQQELVMIVKPTVLEFE